MKQLFQTKYFSIFSVFAFLMMAGGLFAMSSAASAACTYDLIERPSQNDYTEVRFCNATAPGKTACDTIANVPCGGVPFNPDTVCSGAVNGAPSPFTNGTLCRAGGTVNPSGFYPEPGACYAHVFQTVCTVGTINVSANVAGASYTITGPATLNGSTPNSYANQPTGVYTITWNDVAGYTKPVSPDQTLLSGGAITFSGTYTAVACDLGCGGFVQYRATAMQQINDFSCPSDRRLRTSGGSWVTACSGVFTQNPGGGTLSCDVDPTCVAPTINVHF